MLKRTIQAFGVLLTGALLLTACGSPNVTSPTTQPTQDRFANPTAAQGSSGPNSQAQPANPGGQNNDPNIATLPPSTSSASSQSTMNATMAATSSAAMNPAVGSTMSATANATMAATMNATPCPAQMATAGATMAATSAAMSAAAGATSTTNPNAGYLGITGETVPNCGVRITQIRAGSVAEVDQLKVGDIIVSVDNQPVMSNEALAAILDRHIVNDRLAISVIRNNQTVQVNVTLMAQPNANTTTVPTRAATMSATASH